MAVADAHTAGARPFARSDYIAKFRTLTEGLISDTEAKRFLALIENLAALDAKGVRELNVRLDTAQLIDANASRKGIF